MLAHAVAGCLDVNDDCVVEQPIQQDCVGRIATRYDKLAANFLSTIYLAAIVQLLVMSPDPRTECLTSHHF